MSIEIEIRTGEAGWPAAKPLLTATWPAETAATRVGGSVEWAPADLRVLIEDAEQGNVLCHVGIHRRVGTWKGRKVRIGGIGGVATDSGSRRKGHAGLALSAAIQTLRDEKATDFLLLVCQPHNFAFYEKRGWHAFEGELYAEQKGERIRFDVMKPYVFDMRYGPREGTIDLCGLPW